MEKAKTNSKSNIHKGHRERMRKRFIETAGEGFSDHEFLEFLLFYSIPRSNTNETAHLLLERFGSLEGVFSAKHEELLMVDGVGETSAQLIKSVFGLHMRMIADHGKGVCFTTIEQVGEYFRELFMHSLTESMILLLFDKKGRINRKIDIAGGDINQAVIDIKKLVAASSSTGAYSAAIAHNHPSGVLRHSFDDKVATLKIKELFDTLGIRFLEHFVITEDGYTGLLNSGVAD